MKLISSPAMYSPDQNNQYDMHMTNLDAISLISQISPDNSTSINLTTSNIGTSTISKSINTASSTKALIYYKKECENIKKCNKKLKAKIKKFESELNNNQNKKVKKVLEFERKARKYKLKTRKLIERCKNLDKKLINCESQTKYLNKLLTDHKSKIKQLEDNLNDTKNSNNELTMKIVDFIQREQQLMSKNESLIKKCRNMKSKSVISKRSIKPLSPKIKVMRLNSNEKKTSSKLGSRRFISPKKTPKVKRSTTFSFSSFFGRK